MYRIQEFMIERIYEEPTGNRTIISLIITPQTPETRNCSVLACEPCMLARNMKISTEATKVNPLLEKEGTLTRDKYEIGDFFSTD